MKYIYSLFILLFVVPAHASVIECRAFDAEGGLTQFQYDTVSDRGWGFYDDLDAGQRVTLVRAKHWPAMNPVKISVTERKIFILLEVVNKMANAFEENESNPEESLQTRFRCQ